jgi:hypothetical protein
MKTLPEGWSLTPTGRIIPTPPKPERHVHVVAGCVETFQDGAFHHTPVRVLRAAIGLHDLHRARAHRFLCPPIGRGP